MTKKGRTQLLLSPEEHFALLAISENMGMSMSQAAGAAVMAYASPDPVKFAMESAATRLTARAAELSRLETDEAFAAASILSECAEKIRQFAAGG